MEQLLRSAVQQKALMSDMGQKQTSDYRLLMFRYSPKCVPPGQTPDNASRKDKRPNFDPAA
jgi:hypothetical protein